MLRQVYKVPKPEGIEALRLVLSVPTLRVLDDRAVRDALALYVAHAADFADCLLSIQSRAEGTELTTFDKGASRLPGTRRLGDAE